MTSTPTPWNAMHHLLLHLVLVVLLQFFAGRAVLAEKHDLLGSWVVDVAGTVEAYRDLRGLIYDPYQLEMFPYHVYRIENIEKRARLLADIKFSLSFSDKGKGYVSFVPPPSGKQKSTVGKTARSHFRYERVPKDDQKYTWIDRVIWRLAIKTRNIRIERPGAQDEILKDGAGEMVLYTFGSDRILCQDGASNFPTWVCLRRSDSTENP